MNTSFRRYNSSNKSGSYILRNVMKITGLLLICILNISMQVHADTVKETQCEQAIQGCTCKWVNGKKAMVCDESFSGRLSDLSGSETQILILDNKEITVLRNNTFRQSGLVNLQEISLRNCSLREVEKNALSGLDLLIELDLSNNLIQNLQPSLFAPTKKLRYVKFNNNSLEKLEDGLFANLNFLQIIELDDNRISHISDNAFDKLPALRSVKLNGNQLTYLNKSTFDKVSKRLDGLAFKNNPLKCDCHLRDFIEWYIGQYFYSDSTTCAEPGSLRGLSWKSIQPSNFTC